MSQAQHAQQLADLRDDLLRLGSMVEHALINAVHSLEQWDTVAAARVLAEDVRIDAVHRATEEQIIHLIGTHDADQQGTRLLVAAFAIASELERIGDYACSIARRVERITHQAAIVSPPSALSELIDLARRMLNISLEAFLRQNSEMAYRLRHEEERVDALEQRLGQELLALAHAEPHRLEAVIGMLDIVHALERVADRTTNIGERVIYLATSVQEELNP
jgi:phosphate transport system protein